MLSFDVGPLSSAATSANEAFFKALAWTVTCVVAALTVGRYMIRMKRLTGLHCDDGLHALALIALVAYTATFTASLPMVYALKSWVEGRGPAPSASTLKRYLRFALAASVVFWICIYSVKFAFLAFYRHLFGVSRGFMKAWWAVFAWAVLTFCVCGVSNAFLCVDSSNASGTFDFFPHSTQPIIANECLLVIRSLSISSTENHPEGSVYAEHRIRPSQYASSPLDILHH